MEGSNQKQNISKNVLIVYAHPEKKSFNSALLEVAKTTLKKQGCHVKVSDLYKMNFNPCFSRNDIQGAPYKNGYFHLSEEAGKAYSEGKLSPDIVEEQEKLTWADLVIFQFPLCWMSMPAILKGWFDRVFVENYAFTVSDIYETAGFKGKKALLSITTGAVEGWYTNMGPNGDIEVLLWPIQNGILRLTGFDVLSPQISWCPGFVEEEKRKEMLRDWEQKLVNIFLEKPLQFIPFSDFELVNKDNPMEGHKVKDQLIESAINNQCGLSVGQHLGLPLPQNTMINKKS